MSDCAACASLVGKPVDVEPHRGLSTDVVIMKPDGELIHYTCRLCRARWERFKTNERFRGKPQYWSRI